MSACPLPNKVVVKTKPTKKYIAPPPPTPSLYCNFLSNGNTGNTGGGGTPDSGSGGSTTPTVVPQKAALSFKGTWAAGTAYTIEKDGTASAAPQMGCMVQYKGCTYVCAKDHAAAEDNAPGTDGGKTYWTNIAAYDIVAGIEYKADWETGYDYTQMQDMQGEENVPLVLGALVRYKGHAYICIKDHKSDDTNAPGTTGGADYWTDLVTASGTTTEPSLFDNLKNGLFDWLKDMPNWGVGDWLTAIAAGAGIIWAGKKVVDAITGNGQLDGKADQRFTGTPVYTGSFTPPTLKTIVSSLCDLAGLTSYDVSRLQDVNTNFVIASMTSVRNVLEQLSFAYQFDMVDSGGTLKFVPKVGAPVATLTMDDIGYSSSSDDVAPYAATRSQGIDLPQSVTINYSSPTLDYNTFSQVARLQTFPDGQVTQYDLPFTMQDSEAYALAESSLITAYVSRNVYTFTTSYNHIFLEPGDIIDTPMGTLRILKIEEKDEGLLEMAAAETFTSLSPSSVAVQVAQPLDNSPPILGYSGCFFLDLPPLDVTDNTPRMHLAVHGYGAKGWPGAAVFVSKDGGASFDNFSSSSKEATFGLVASAVPSADFNVWDNTTQIVVQLKTGVLESKTDLDVLNGANRCMIGQEMIHFGTATLIGDKQYRLSHLLRGRQGTEWAVSSHQANELFVMIDDALVRIDMDYSEKGHVQQYKTVTFGSDVSVVTAESAAPNFVNMVPWAVANPKAVKTGNDWVISWQERARFSPALQDYTEIQHDPDWAGWTLAIMQGETVKKTMIIQAPTFTYTAAMQQADFGAVQTNLSVRIFAMSTKGGGGYAAFINS